jgi:hypothetical protein
MPNFDKNTGFTMNIGGNSKVNDGSFNEKQTGLLKTAPMYKNLVGDQDKLPTDLKDAIKASPVRKNGDKGIGMAGDNSGGDGDNIQTEKLDNVTMYGKSKKPYFRPSEVGGTDSVNSPSGGASFTPQTGKPIEKMTTAQLLAERKSKKLKS